MPAKPAPEARYLITGVIVGPFKAGEVVSAEQIRTAGLDLDHLFRLGQIDIAPAAPAAEKAEA